MRLKLEEYGLAIADACASSFAVDREKEADEDTARAIELDPKFVKAYFRRATANLAIMKPKAALVDLKQVRLRSLPRL